MWNKKDICCPLLNSIAEVVKVSALSFEKLEEAYIMVYKNAKELLEEAKILLDHKKYARTYTLSQIAHEELAKLPIIFQEATRAFYKEGHDWKNFYSRLKNHTAKNRMNYVTQDLVMQSAGYKLNEISYEQIKDNMKYINDLKNFSLYADIKGKRFTKPSKEINLKLAKAQYEMVEEQFKIFSLNKLYIKGNMKRNLSSEEGIKHREFMRKSGLIK